MQNVSIQKAENLSADVKTALETLLGRSLSSDEEVSVLAFRPHEAPDAAIRHQLAERLEDLMDKMGKRVEGAPDEELDEILDEAMRSARPGYRRKQ